MWFAFVDDSATNDPPREGLGELVALGAVLVPEDQVKAYGERLSAIRSRCGLPPDEEFKWKPARDSALYALDGERRFAVRKAMLVGAAELGVRSTVVVWDRGHLGWEKERILPEIRKYLYERIEMCLQANGQTGVVIADEPGGGRSENCKWLTSTLELTKEGTEYVRPKSVVLPMLTSPSHHVPHIQLADLVTAATTAAIAGRKSGLSLIELLSRLAHTNAWGQIGGAGVKLCPAQLNNLHHWIWGETDYMYRQEWVRLPSTGQSGPMGHFDRPWSYIDGSGLPA